MKQDQFLLYVMAVQECLKLVKSNFSQIFEVIN